MTTTAQQDFTEGETQPESGCDLDQTQRDLVVGAMKREGCSEGRNLLVIKTGQPLPSESRTPQERAAFEQLYRASRQRMEAEHEQLLDELHQAGIKLSHVRAVPVRQLRLMAKSRAGTAASRPNSDTRPRGSRRPRSATRRSSSRSGDSGDDGPGEPAPSDLPALAPATRDCAICGEDITHRRADAETCGPTHKKTLQREREKRAARVPPP